MKCSLLAALLATALVTGCKKSETANNAAPPAADNSQPATAPTDTSSTTPPPPGGAPVEMPAPIVRAATISAPDNGNMSKTLSDLTLSVRGYIASTHSVPASFEDFVAKTHLQVPPPPVGKKYALDSRRHVILVNE